MATMIDSIQSQLHLNNYKLYLWTDSTIVLAWLQKSPNKWKTFVENRISSIVEKVGSDSWAHVASKDNPADMATRGLTVSELSSSNLWWHGPAWLKRPHEEWPSRTADFSTEEEIKPIHVHSTMIGGEDILKDFSDFPRALRAICHVFRFYDLAKRKLHRGNIDPQVFSSAELNLAKSRLIIASQKYYFESEYNQLTKSLPLSRKSHLLTLNPFLDSHGIMRINGRLAQSPTLSYDERYPILLPYHARFTRLFLTHLHKYSLHGQNALLYRLMRLHYYVPKLKTLIKAIISNCLICVKHKH